ncbi:ly6/PLAUR domain-containing protein 2-like isoform X3 [Tenebrio molitor]|jgi:hypothetical protein|uniref:ly6/PLAUR domain-containing protein 2-like isoform X3 n=1 Tax=Tenebrio molitor TaxID=7067 RepID=UPI003624A5A6
MGVNCLLAAAVLGGFVASAVALQCYQCGQYNDGVGSITPCINETHMELKECPSLNHVYCIKYISEGSTVRDCVPKCTEREDWGTRTFCCAEPGCNAAPTKTSAVVMVALLTILAMH